MLRPVSLFNGFVWLILTFPLFAAPVDDIRIVIDVSGSMQKTDPNNLRAPALRMINGLIPTGSKAGVWTFGRYVNMEVKWGKVNDRWRKKADAGAKKIHSKGQFTNIESALKRAIKGWEKKDPNTRRNLILLTDGKVDISKDPEKNALSRSKVLNKSIQELVKKGVKVHTIALSDQTDEALLKRIALKTSGSFEVAESADDLQRIFLRMFERATKPDTVPLKNNSFTIDKSISEMTLLVFRKGRKETRLVQPDKVKHSESKHAKNVSWRFERGYDLVTVAKPKPGVWSLEAEIDDDNRVMIVTELKLVVEDLPAYISPDQSLNIQMELHNKDKKISKKSFLKFVDFNLQHSYQDKTKTLALKLKKSRDIKDKGIYLNKIKAPLDEGQHEVLVTADARTFNRSKRYSVQVQWPVQVELNTTEQAGIFNLSVLAREEYIKPDTLQLDVNIKKPDDSIQKVEVMTLGNQPEIKIHADEQNGLYQVQIKIKAETVDGEIVQHTLEDYPAMGVKVEKKEEEIQKQQSVKTEATPDPDSEAVKIDALKPAEIIQEEVIEEEEGGWVDTVIYVSIANVAIIIIVVATLLFMRKRKKNDDLESLEDDQEEDGDLLNV